MKKTIKSVLQFGAAICVAFSIIASSPVATAQESATTVVPTATSAQVAPTVLPIASEAFLKAYALTQVKQIGVQVYGKSVSGTSYTFFDYSNNDADPGKMAALVRQQNLAFSVDPAEELTSLVNYMSKTVIGNYTGGYTLFSGGTNFYMQQSNGVYVVPRGAFTNHLVMSDYIPFPMKNISYAYIETKDENGNVNGYYNFGDEGRVDTANGLLYLGRKHTGLRGTLYAGFNDGSQASYSVGDGHIRPVVSSTYSATTASIDGIRTLPDNTTNIVYQAGDQIVRVKYTANLAVAVTFPNGLSQYPSEVHAIDSVILANDPYSQWLDFNPLVEQVKFTVIPQVVLIRFEYPDDSHPLNSYNYGGKG